jgi:hypothetical protein
MTDSKTKDDAQYLIFGMKSGKTVEVKLDDDDDLDDEFAMIYKTMDAQGASGADGEHTTLIYPFMAVIRVSEIEYVTAGRAK